MNLKLTYEEKFTSVEYLVQTGSTGNSDQIIYNLEGHFRLQIHILTEKNFRTYN